MERKHLVKNTADILNYFIFLPGTKLHNKLIIKKTVFFLLLQYIFSP